MSSLLVARDDFVRADGALGANWTSWTNAGGLIISADKVTDPGTGDDFGNVWTANTYDPDQFSQVKTSVVPTGSGYFGPVVRADSTGDNCYEVIVHPSSAQLMLFKRATGNNFTSLASVAATFSVGDVVRLSAIGTTLTVNFNGTDVITFTDSSYTTGQPGVTSAHGTGSFNSWSGGNGPGIVQVSFTSTSGHVDTYSVLSQINAASSLTGQDMKVLRPDAPNPNYAPSVLWLLPVSPTGDFTYGDAIATIQALGAQNAYNLTCILPGFEVDPWYGNNDHDPATQQETFILDLVTFYKASLAVTGSELHYLIGFSKSGFGGQILFLRNQPVFTAVASWDARMDVQDVSLDDVAAVFNNNTNLAGYELYPPNLATWKAEGDTGTVDRIWLGAGIDLITQTSDYSTRLTTAGLLHTYSFTAADSHQWAPTPGWVGPALAAITGHSRLSVTGLIMSSGII